MFVLVRVRVEQNCNNVFIGSMLDQGLHMFFAPITDYTTVPTLVNPATLSPPPPAPIDCTICSGCTPNCTFLHKMGISRLCAVALDPSQQISVANCVTGVKEQN